MSEVEDEIIKTEETRESGIKYLNINVSNSEVERNPDVVRLCADAGILEYVKPKTGHWVVNRDKTSYRKDWQHICSACGSDSGILYDYPYCPNCGAKMVEPQKSVDKE